MQALDSGNHIASMNVSLLAPVLLVLSLVLPTLVLAQDDIDCSEQALVLKSLHQDVNAAETIVQHLRSVVEDSAAADAGTEQLEALLAARAGEQDSQVWPEQLSCASLTDEYAEARAQLQRTQGHISNLRDRLWRKQPVELREALLNIWRSRQRVLLHQQEVLAAVDPVYLAEVEAYAAEH